MVRAHRFVLPLLLAVLALPVFAEDDDPNAVPKELIASLSELRKAGDVSGLQEAVERVPHVYADTMDKALRSKMCAEVGKILKDKDAGAARSSAAEVLTQLDDPKTAWKYLSKVLPDPKWEEVDAFYIVVIDSAGKVAYPKSVKALLELAAKSKDNQVAAHAVMALGNFGEDKRARVTVLEELMSVVQRIKPGHSTSKQTSPEAMERWGTIQPAMLGALNQLTGQNVATFEDWEELWREHKRNPKSLFIRD